MILTPVAVVIFIAIVNERLIEGFVAPIFDKFNIDKFWLKYIAWVTGGLLTWLTGVNLFQSYLPSVLAGLILTAIVAGGGSNLLHDLFDRQTDQPAR
jgi:hypothetical protein